MNPKVSVVMSCYNSEEYVAKAINSVLVQSYTDFEFIIWNDGSTDNTEKIVKTFHDKRIRYFYHENTGLGMALKLACNQARGEYIARMDADDISAPSRLQEQYDYLSSHPETVLVSSAVNYINESGTKLRRSLPYTNNKVISKIMLTTGHSVVVHPSTMFRKTAYFDAGGYMPLKKAQDIVLFSRMCKLGVFYTFRKTLLNYRLTENSISTQTDSSSYSPIINAYLRKFSSDEQINDEDVERYNEVVSLSKKEIKRHDIKILNNQRNTISAYVKMYNFLKCFLGESFAANIVISLKNIGARIQYKV